MLFFLYFLLGLTVGGIIVFLWLSSKGDSSLKIKIEKDQIEKEREALKEENQQIIPLKEDNASLKTQNEEKVKEIENQKQTYEEKLKEREEHFEKNLNLKKDHYEEKLRDQEKGFQEQKEAYQKHFEKELNTQKQAYEEKLKSQEKSFQEQKEASQKHFEEKERYFKELAEKTKAEFENTAKEIFEKNTKSYREESSKDLSQILKPFKEDIEGFKKSVQGFESKEEFLKKTISDFQKINLDMRDETKDLTSALKGDVRAQGEWGEFVLANILEKSGLRKGEEFFEQGKDLDTKDEKGSAVRPDVIVRLPEGKHIVIDSKVSLTHFQDYFSSPTEEEREAHKLKISHSVSLHIKSLSSKKYHLSEGIRSPDFTMMFIPNEGAFSIVTQAKDDLFKKAWDHSIALVSPSTLYAVLKTVASIWKVEAYNKNAEEIARQGGRLYDKFFSFLEDMRKIDGSLTKARDSYDSAIGKLTSGRGNLIRSVKKLQKLGVKNEKQIPQSFTEE